MAEKNIDVKHKADDKIETTNTGDGGEWVGISNQVAPLDKMNKEPQ